MFEYDVTFPYDSQLTVSINDTSLLSGSYEIGRTNIDLENRYYSNCYALCGLQKRYETSGYNFWRDSHSPREILYKMCKQHGVQKPKYDTDGNLIMIPLQKVLQKINKINNI